MISNLQKHAKEEKGENKSLHQLRKEREADREEKIQVTFLRETNMISRTWVIPKFTHWWWTDDNMLFSQTPSPNLNTCFYHAPNYRIIAQRRPISQSRCWRNVTTPWWDWKWLQNHSREASGCSHNRRKFIYFNHVFQKMNIASLAFNKRCFRIQKSIKTWNNKFIYLNFRTNKDV